MALSRGRLWALGVLMTLYILGMVFLSAVTLYEPRGSAPGSHLDHVYQPSSLLDRRALGSPVDTAVRSPSLKRSKLHWCSGLRYLEPPRYPTALASFPGSGNTWLRYLLQQATGIYTGSVYTDYGLLKNGFPAESVCDGSVLVVKTHEWGSGARKKFQKAVLLVRGPGQAIQAEFNRQSGGHVGFASPDRYTRTRGKYWQQFVTNKLAIWKQFNLDWLHNFTGPTHVIFYDKLVQDVETTLKQLLQFLEYPVPEKNLSCALDRKEGIYRRRKRVINFDPFTAKMKKILAEEQQKVYTAIHNAIQQNTKR